MTSLRSIFASLLVSSSAAVTQPHGFNPPGPEVAIALDLDAARAGQANSILHLTRGEMEKWRAAIPEHRAAPVWRRA